MTDSAQDSAAPRDRRELEAALEKTNRELIAAARIAGTAEVATSVLHNVGNVLNSLNVSAAVVSTAIRQSKVGSLARVCAILDEHENDLGAFLKDDPKGKLVPEFLRSLARHLGEEQSRLLAEVETLQRNLDHVKEIVTMQQTYATLIGVVESLSPAALMEDAIRMNATSLQRRDVTVVRDFHSAPCVYAERGKVLQILINLIRNATHALDEGGGSDKVLTLGVEPGPLRTVRFVIRDNGVGIRPENLPLLFTRGFTTRANGHGFGLHSSATAARDLQGRLTVHSDGPGTGACFALELPAAGAGQDNQPAAA